jgi:DNA-binding CsgD family transcriptional regulator
MLLRPSIDICPKELTRDVRGFFNSLLAHHGYRLKEFLCGPIGQEAFRSTLSAGFRLRRDYSDYYQARNLPMPQSWQRPWLVGLTREEASADYGSGASGLFVFTPPRFHFTHCEQAILRRSLAGETDEEIAVNLLISHWTVKKRWHAIYKRVADVAANSCRRPTWGWERNRVVWSVGGACLLAFASISKSFCR